MEKSQKTFIYVLSDPISDHVFYVGKSDYPEKRYIKHVNDKSKTHKVNKIQSISKLGLKPTLEIVDEVPISEWKFWESFYFQLFKGWGFNLVNDPNAIGNGCAPFKGHKHSDEAKAKMTKPRAWNEEQKEELSKKVSGINNPLYGKSGGKSPVAKKVEQIDTITGEVIEQWDSISEAEKKLNICSGSISAVCKSHLVHNMYVRKTAGGFIWRYK